MTSAMDQKKLQAMAEELAKDVKTPADLAKLTVEAALNGEVAHP